MNSNLTPGHDPAPRTPPSAARQIDWQFLDAVGARAALAGLPSEAPVLLVTFQENHVGAIKPFTHEEVLEQIKSLKSNKAKN